MRQAARSLGLNLLVVTARRQHLHWTNLMQSLPKTFSAHHAPPLVADLAKVMELYDLSDAASIWSS
jgi:hypothetical protein